MNKLRFAPAVFPLLVGCGLVGALAMATPLDGGEVNLGNLYRVSKAESRSISPENLKRHVFLLQRCPTLQWFMGVVAGRSPLMIFFGPTPMRLNILTARLGLLFLTT